MDKIQKNLKIVALASLLTMFAFGKSLQFFYLMNSCQLLFNDRFYFSFKKSVPIVDREKEKGNVIFGVIYEWMTQANFFVSGQMPILIEYLNKNNYQFHLKEYDDDEYEDLSELQKKIIKQGINTIPEQFSKDFTDLPRKIVMDPIYYIINKVSGITNINQKKYINTLQNVSKDIKETINGNNQ